MSIDCLAAETREKKLGSNLEKNGLESLIQKLRNSQEIILNIWLNNLDVQALLKKHSINVDLFSEEFGEEILQYFLASLDGEKHKHSQLVKLIKFFKDKHIDSADVHAIYLHLKVAIMQVVDSSGSISNVIHLFDSAFHGILTVIDRSIQDAFHTDKRTKLPNQDKMLLDIENIKGSKLVYMRIHSLTDINDQFGRKVGDEILKSFAVRLRNIALEVNASSYCLHGGKFSLLVSNIDEAILQKMYDILSSPYQIISDDGSLIDLEIDITLGAGIDTEHLMHHADRALFYTKKNDLPYCLYDTKIQELDNRKKELIQKVKEAIESGCIVPFFQPIYNNQTGSIEKYECLARILGDENISPAEFIEAIKNTHLYHQLTRIIVQKSLEFFQNKSYEFSLNLSLRDIQNDAIRMGVLSAIDQSGIGERIIVEILETEEMSDADYENIDSFVEALRQYKCKVAIDDFGSGFSNLQRIMMLKPDFIKIDRALISSLEAETTTSVIVEGTIKMAHKLGIKVIAEGVETEKIQRILEDFSVDYSQGYYFGKPQKDLVKNELAAE